MYRHRFSHYFIERTSLAILVICVIVAQSGAHAAPAPEPVLVAEAAQVITHEITPEITQEITQASAAPVLGEAADSAALDSQRGGTDTVNNNMQLDGGVHDNVANNVVTGSNTIDAGSFANMSGIPTVIQNSGANVLIQSATIINLQFK